MHLSGLSERIPTVWPTEDFDQWTARLQSICGHFNPKRTQTGNRVTGGARVDPAGGLELAQLANDLDLIRRDPGDIRADQGDNLFLLLQLEGRCGIEQFGHQERLDPGDCILVDSSSPSVFYFGGHFSNHLSVHLPRQFLLSDQTARVSIARKIGRDDPLSTMLAALIAKLMHTTTGDTRASQLRDLLFTAARQAFSLEGGPSLPPSGPDHGLIRIEIIRRLIDENLTESWLTPQWLAERAGISLRRLQEDLNAHGMTVTSLIKTARLHLAKARLARLRDPGSGSGGTIADIAYSVGFNDISYFNRSFRKLFDCAPRDVLSE